MQKMQELITKLHLNKIGFLELLMAMYPILNGYVYTTILNFSILVPIFLILFALNRKPKVAVKPYKPLFVLFIYIMVHNILWIPVIGGAPSYYINTWILYILTFLTIFIVTPRLDMDKFLGSINWVAIVCVIGMFYQGAIVLGGRGVTPLILPFLPTPPIEVVEIVRARPSSFFWEPNGYTTFMLMPLLISLRNKANVWSLFIVISLFLSTSTTGLITSFIIVALNGVSEKKGKSKIYAFVLLAVMYLLLSQTSFFEFGVDKLNDSDVTTDSRTANGPTFVFAMPWQHLILGGPFANTGDYYASGVLGVLDIRYQGNVYMATLWQMIALYGIVGAILLVWLYLRLYKDCKISRPYIVCLIIQLVTAAFFLGGPFCIQMVFILCLKYNIDVNKSTMTPHLNRVTP